MPIYEYRCSDCGNVVEKIERKPAESVPCPCGGEARPIVSRFSGKTEGASGGGCVPTGGFR